MDSFQIFGVQFLLSLVVYGLLAKWYVAPALARLPLHDALIPLLVPHAFRHLGLVFLVPAVVAPPPPPPPPAPSAGSSWSPPSWPPPCPAPSRFRRRTAISWPGFLLSWPCSRSGAAWYWGFPSPGSSTSWERWIYSTPSTRASRSTRVPTWVRRGTSPRSSCRPCTSPTS